MLAQQLDGKLPLLLSEPVVETHLMFPERTVNWQLFSASSQVEAPAEVVTTTVPVAAAAPIATLMVSSFAGADAALL
jgi:hypothetical protein